MLFRLPFALRPSGSSRARTVLQVLLVWRRIRIKAKFSSARHQLIFTIAALFKPTAIFAARSNERRGIATVFFVLFEAGQVELKSF
jgi:hypothetical protein